MVDFFGTEQIYGKTLHTDLMKGKYTLPLLLLYDAMDASGRAHLLDSLQRVDEAVYYISRVFAGVPSGALMP